MVLPSFSYISLNYTCHFGVLNHLITPGVIYCDYNLQQSNLITFPLTLYKYIITVTVIRSCVVDGIYGQLAHKQFEMEHQSAAET